MTVIAYDAKTKTLAVDSLYTNGERIGYVKKFRVLNDGRAVVVIAGDYALGRKAMKLVEAGKPLTDTIGAGVTVVLMHLSGKQKGQVFVCEDGPDPQRVKQSEAWGSGSDFAIAALDAGASAEEAVKIACKRSASCGGKVHVFTPES